MKWPTFNWRKSEPEQRDNTRKPDCPVLGWTHLRSQLNAVFGAVPWGSGAQAELAGKLTVTSVVSYLSAPGKEKEAGGHILVFLSPQIERILGNNAPIGGSMFFRTQVSAKVRGGFVQSDLPMFQAAVLYLDKMEVEDEHGVSRVIYSTPPPSFDPSTIDEPSLFPPDDLPMDPPPLPESEL